jgi:hypothetical protein
MTQHGSNPQEFQDHRQGRRPATTKFDGMWERQLDILFAAGTISEAQVDQRVTEIATMQGQLRAVHLRAHLAQSTLLTSEQLRRYDMLRGYNVSHPDHSGPHRGH